MARPKNPKHPMKTAKEIVEKTRKGKPLPPTLGESKVKAPKQFETIGDVISEQQRLYKLVFTGEIMITDLTKLMYALGQIIQGIKTESDMAVLENAYSKQWSGVTIVAPVKDQDPHDTAIEGEIVDG